MLSLFLLFLVCIPISESSADDGPSESLACGKLRGYDDVGEVARLLEKAKKRTDAYKAKFHMQPSSGDQTGSFSKKNTKSGNNNKKETGHNFSSTAGSPQGAKQGKGKGHENGADSASTRTDSTRNVEKLGEKQEKSKANVREKVSDEFVPMSEGVKSKIAIEEKKLGINRATMLRSVSTSPLRPCEVRAASCCASCVNVNSKARFLFDHAQDKFCTRTDTPNFLSSEHFSPHVAHSL